jgi:hypothetical protein
MPAAATRILVTRVVCAALFAASMALPLTAQTKSGPTVINLAAGDTAARNRAVDELALTFASLGRDLQCALDGVVAGTQPVSALTAQSSIPAVALNVVLSGARAGGWHSGTAAMPFDLQRRALTEGSDVLNALSAEQRTQVAVNAQCGSRPAHTNAFEIVRWITCFDFETQAESIIQTRAAFGDSTLVVQMAIVFLRNQPTGAMPFVSRRQPGLRVVSVMVFGAETPQFDPYDAPAVDYVFVFQRPAGARKR